MSIISFEKKLQEYQQNNFYRQRNILEDGADIKVTLNGNQYISFSSNNYLGLAKHPKIIQAVIDGAKKYGAGVAASQLVAGHTRAHRELELAMADFLQCESCLLFSSGYLANLGVISSLFSEKDVIFADKLNHVSLLDGCRLSGAQLKRYLHADMLHLQKLLQGNQVNKRAIITDSIFSMSGDIAPLQNLKSLADQFQILLIIDEAHALGVMGKEGQGAYLDANKNSDKNVILICPLGKAFGCYGAMVAGSKILVENILQSARTLIYNIALPPMIACAALQSLEIVRAETWRRRKLTELIEFFRYQTKKRQLNFINSSTPIQIFKIGEEKKALFFANELLKYGFYTNAIRWPSVPKNAALLRISLTAMHEELQIEGFLDALQKIDESINAA